MADYSPSASTLLSLNISIPALAMKYMTIRKLWKQLLLVLALVMALLYISQYHGISMNILKYFNVISGNQNLGSDLATVADNSVKGDNYKVLLEQLNRDKVAQDDPRLIKIIQEHFIEPPSTQPYKLEQPDRIDYSQGQSSAVDHILKEMEGGFFVECGGFDGETSSNSLFFEKTRKWSGMLIEADPFHYRALKTRNRKAFTVNACLSTEPYPVVLPFNRDDKRNRQRGRLVHTEEGKAFIARKGISKDEIQVQCFPVYSLLLAVNHTKVDLFSLDIEGDELHILKTIPFDKVDIPMMNVEIVHGKRPDLVDFLRSKGYHKGQRIRYDIIFKKKDQE